MKQECSILDGGCFWGTQDLLRDGELIRTAQGVCYVFAANVEIVR